MRAAAGRPIVLRADEFYAAMIASGCWKAKKHKASAAKATHAWKVLKSKLHGRLWLLPRGRSTHAGHATGLATEGYHGARVYKRHAETD